MNNQFEKCVIVIDEELPIGLASNTAAIIGITLGKHINETVGPEVVDGDGRIHLGTIQFPVPILKSGKDRLKQIREQIYQSYISDLVAVDFTDTAQSCNMYSEYIEKISHVRQNHLEYLGIGICGSKKLVNKLTGNLPLLR